MADHQLLVLALTRLGQLTGTSAVATALLPPLAAADDALREAVLQWPSSPRFSLMDRACLAFVEQVQLDPTSVTSAQVDEMRLGMTSAEVLGFASAVYVLDAEIRVVAVLSQVLGEPAVVA
jgi:hypothetical protein